MKGLAYVFLRKDGAPLPPGCAGHVGWGFSLLNGEFFFGSTENTSGQPFVQPGGNNGWWGKQGGESEMVQEMRTRDYDGYKVATVRTPDVSAAQAKALSTRNVGYVAIKSNCLDHVWWILQAYGVDDLPWLQTHPSPNDWFAVFNGEYRNL